MLKNFKPVRDLQQIADEAATACKGKRVVHNLLLQHSFPVALLDNPFRGLHDAKAEEWQQPQTPKNLHINHGHFIHARGDGVQHIIDELKRKEDSNRALYSLISMPDIVGQRDLPIPSFMILQFGLSGTSLFITAYFRALEVCKFLPINLAEICLVARKIHREFQQVRKILLCIHAFQAHYKPHFDCLEKSRLDQLEAGTICGLLADPAKKDEVRGYLESKFAESTVIETSRLSDMCDYLKTTRPTTQAFYSKSFLFELEQAVNALEELRAARAKSSHSPRIQEHVENFKRHLKAALAAM